MAVYRSEVLVGRDAELEELRATAKGAARGEPGVVLMLGEAGVGKSRLVAEATAELEAAGALVAVSHGVELSGGELPYGGVTELVRDLTRALGVAKVRRLAGTDALTLGAFHPELGRPTGPPERAAVTASLLRLLERLPLDRLVCWVLEDLPWMDAPSRDLATYLARLARGRLLLVATVRTPPSDPSGLPEELVGLAQLPAAQVIALGPLDDDGVAAQVAAIAGTSVDSERVSRICRLSDGLPFFVEQLVACAGEAPVSLRALVLNGIHGLSDDARKLLRAAAVGERLLIPRLLRQIAGLQEAEFERALAEVRGRGLLRLDRAGEVLRFRHALLREAIDGELLAEGRRALHRAWALTLDDLDDLDDLPDLPVSGAVLVAERALHWYESGDREAAFGSVLAAARQVEEDGNFDLQARWWGRALELWGGEPQRDGVRRDGAVWRYVFGLLNTWQLERAGEVVEAELEGENDRLRGLWLRALAYQVRRMQGMPANRSVPLDEVDETLTWLTLQPADFRVDATLHLLLHQGPANRPDLFRRICGAILDRSRATGLSDNAVMARRYLGWYEHGRGNPEGQLAHCLAGLEEAAGSAASTAEAAGDAAWAYAEAGRYREALEFGSRALAQVRDPRVQLLAWSRLIAARIHILHALGHWDEAMRLTQDALTLLPRDNPHHTFARAVVTEILVEQGDPSGAAANAAFIDPDVPVPEVIAAVMRLVHARSTMLLAGPVGVRPAIEVLVAIVDLGISAPYGWPLIVAGLRITRDPSDIRLALEQTRRLPAGGPINTASADEVAAHETRAERTDRPQEWMDVADQWAAMGRVYDEAWCRLFAAEALLREGNRGGARYQMTLARDICESLRSVVLRNRLRALGRRGRLDVVKRAEVDHQDNGTPGLTARETEVLALLSIGHTNAQIAETLFMSPKTASVHVSRILTKLDAANRTEAAAHAHRMGLVPPT